MSMKIISILLLLSCVNITLGDKDCYVKLYPDYSILYCNPEENFRGSTVRAVSDSTLIKSYSFSEELILASKNCSLSMSSVRVVYIKLILF